LQPNFTTELIQIIDNEPCISHRTIAKNTQNKVLSVQKLITDNIDVLEEFGKVRFEIEAIINSKNKVNEEKTYFLNEQQTALILTFMRNNEIIKNFKIKLVKEFFKMRHQLPISKTEKPKNLISVSDSELDRELKTLKFILDNFNLSEKEKIEKSNEVFQNINFIVKLENPHLKKREAVFTLTQLLAEFGISISTKDFNLKLESFGIIERFGSGWILLEMKFGENRETQNGKNHRYYKSSFQELLDIVL